MKKKNYDLLIKESKNKISATLMMFVVRKIIVKEIVEDSGSVNRFVFATLISQTVKVIL